MSALPGVHTVERGTTILSVNDVVSLCVEKAAEHALEVAWDGVDAVWLSFDIDSVPKTRV